MAIIDKMLKRKLKKEKRKTISNLLKIGNDEWSSDPISPYYDYNLIRYKLDHFKQVRENNDVLSMIYMLRSGCYSLSLDLVLIISTLVN